MMIEKIPKWVLQNQGCVSKRQFKQKKRKQLRELKACFWAVWSASAYMPRNSTDALRRMQRDLNKVIEGATQDSWGR